MIGERIMLPTPSCDLSVLNETLGVKGFPDDIPLAQYVAWSDQAGLFSLLAKGVRGFKEICERTDLNYRGADALLGVLAALKLLHRRAGGIFELSEIAREYLLKQSCYYAGPSLLVNCNAPIPTAYVRTRSGSPPAPDRPQLMFGAQQTLENQHARNFAPAVAAVRAGHFKGTRHVVDIGGGSGVFAIPLATDYPEMRITLAELPEAIESCRQLMTRFLVGDRIELLAMDVFMTPWPVPECDGILFGNMFHGFRDALCRIFARESFNHLVPGGCIWLHEMLWYPDRAGPLKTALWNASMRRDSIGDGRQRTAKECIELLESAGFVDPREVPTSGGFSLISARKPDRTA
jgi:O-methyltransferase domain/Dimerisation domain